MQLLVFLLFISFILVIGECQLFDFIKKEFGDMKHDDFAYSGSPKSGSIDEFIKNHNGKLKGKFVESSTTEIEELNINSTLKLPEKTSIIRIGELKFSVAELRLIL